MVEWKPLPTIWDVPDDLWERIGPVILELDPPRRGAIEGGHRRKRVDQRNGGHRGVGEPRRRRGPAGRARMG